MVRDEHDISLYVVLHDTSVNDLLFIFLNAHKKNKFNNMTDYGPAL